MELSLNPGTNKRHSLIREETLKSKKNHVYYTEKDQKQCRIQLRLFIH